MEFNIHLLLIIYYLYMCKYRIIYQIQGQIMEQFRNGALTSWLLCVISRSESIIKVNILLANLI